VDVSALLQTYGFAGMSHRGLVLLRPCIASTFFFYVIIACIHRCLPHARTGAEKAGSMLSTWAGAVLLSSVLFPVNAYMGARIAPYYRRMRTALVP
jgi:hypothetical protein